MEERKLGPVELRFAELIWENAPISSGELVKLCARELEWKKSTTYTVLKKLCDRGIFQNQGGIVTSRISRQDFFGPVMLDFEARTIPPCTHDINCMWSGSWDYETNTRALAYVVGLEGWWDGKVGFEKSPDYRLNCATQYLNFEPGRIYHIQCGSIGGHIFCLIDGVLALEITDPDPIDQTVHGKIGFEAYCSHIQIRKLRVCRVEFQPAEKCYTPEF